ncbi:MAG: hypothetical protein BJ554DRAFT_2022, partial [Olpidium bornovanus]
IYIFFSRRQAATSDTPVTRARTKEFSFLASSSSFSGRPPSRSSPFGGEAPGEAPGIHLQGDRGRIVSGPAQRGPQTSCKSSRDLSVPAVTGANRSGGCRGIFFACHLPQPDPQSPTAFDQGKLWRYQGLTVDVARRQQADMQ